MADQEPRVAGMTVEEIRAYIRSAHMLWSQAPFAQGVLALCDEVERLREWQIRSRSRWKDAIRVGGEHLEEIARLKAEHQQRLDNDGALLAKRDATIETMRQEIHRLKDLGWAQEGEIAVLRKALAAVEWEGYDDGYRHCPSCGEADRKGGHAPDCQLKAALEERRVP